MRFKRLTSAVLSAAMAIACLGASPLSAGAADTNANPDIFIGHPDDFSGKSVLTLAGTIEEISIAGANVDINQLMDNGIYTNTLIGDTFSSGGAAYIHIGANNNSGADLDYIKQNGLALEYTFDIPADGAGEYVIAPTASDPRVDRWKELGDVVGYYSPWHIALDGTPYEMTEYKQWDYSGNKFVDANGEPVLLSEGTHKVTVTFPWNSNMMGENQLNQLVAGFDCIRVYAYSVGKTVCVDYSNVEPSGVWTSKSNRHWNTPVYEFISPYTEGAESLDLSYSFNCGEEGLYEINYIAQCNDGVWSETYGAYTVSINGEAHTANMVRNIPTTEGNGVGLGEYKFSAWLNEGENRITFTKTPSTEATKRYIFWLGKAAFYHIDIAENYIEGENYINAEYSATPDHIGQQSGYGFSGNQALFLVATEEKTAKLEYAVYAPDDGNYAMDFVSLGIGDIGTQSDFDIDIGNVKYQMLNNVTTTGDAVGYYDPWGKQPYYKYSYNNDVYLNKGLNYVTVTVNNRSAEAGGNKYFGLDYIQFTYKGEADTNISVKEWKINNETGDTIITLNNNSDEKPNVIFALYDSDGMLKTAVPAKGDGVSYSFAIPVSEITTLNEEVAVFVWDGNQKPYCEKVSKSITEFLGEST